MSPEYAMEGLFSIKSDVFSFGVLVLEIVSGRKNTSFYHSDSLNLRGAFIFAHFIFFQLDLYLTTFLVSTRMMQHFCCYTIGMEVMEF